MFTIVIKPQNNLENVKPAMSKHTHTQANEVTDTQMKINIFLHNSTAGQQRDLSFPHLCAITNLLGEWNGEFSTPFKTNPGTE